MASQIQLTRSGTPGAQPTATEMELGELALNYADGKLYFKNDTDNIELLNSMSNMSGQKIIVNEIDNHIGLNTTSPNFLLDLGGAVSHTHNTFRINQTTGGTAIRIGSDGEDITLLRVDNLDGETNSGSEGFSIKYLGTNSNVELGIFADNGSSQLQALTILQDGKIGIGTSSPSSKLEVAGTVKSVVGTGAVELNGSDGSIEITRTPTGGTHGLGSGTGPFIDFKTVSGEDYDCRISQTDDDGLAFTTGGDNNVNRARRVTILKDGNVGIGTHTPSHKLEVIGDIFINNGGADGGQLLLGSEGNDTMQIDNESGRFRVANQTTSTELLTVDATGNIEANGDVIATGTATAATPTADTHLTTKAYVDNSIKHGSTPTYVGNQDVIGRTNFSFGMSLQHQGCHMNRVIVYNVTATTPYPVTFIDALDVKITPRDVNSGIMIQAMINGEGNSSEENIVYDIHRKIGSGNFTKLAIRTDVNSSDLIGKRLVGLATNIYDNDEASTMTNAWLQFVDEPQTTEELTYSIGIRSSNSTEWTLNSVNKANDDDAYERATSNVVLTELAGIGT
jgi:hypothetical protein